MPRTSKNAQGLDTARAGSSKTSHARQEVERLARERERLIDDRQEELAVTMEKHDALLREQFHLQSYGFLTYYDPQEAKSVNVNEFEELKSKHDLAAFLPEASSSRTTRHVQTTRLSSLGHLRFPSNVTTPPTRQTQSASLKGKEKEIPMEVSASAGPRPRRQWEYSLRVPSNDGHNNSTKEVTARGFKRKARKMPSPPPPLVSAGSQRFKRSRNGIGTTRREPNTTTVPLAFRPSTAGKTLPGTVHKDDDSPKNSLIRRIKLIVREPPPTLSSHLQKPEPPAFNRSLSALMASYCGPNGDSDIVKLEKWAYNDARILSRVAQLRAEGRMDETKATMPPSSETPRTPNDLWAKVVKDVITTRQNFSSRHRFGRGGTVAAAAQSRINVYWESIRKDERLEAEREEKRIRTLANGVMRLIAAEWFKVYHHIREKERQKEAAEEALRGQKHLDAILDQSGQILTKQQQELVREEDESDVTTSDTMSRDSSDEEDYRENGTSEVTTEPIDGETASVYSTTKNFVDYSLPLNKIDDEEPSLLDFYPRPANRLESTLDGNEESDIEEVDSQLDGPVSQASDLGDIRVLAENEDIYSEDAMDIVDCEMTQLDNTSFITPFFNTEDECNRHDSSSPIEHTYSSVVKESLEGVTSSNGYSSKLPHALPTPVSERDTPLSPIDPRSELNGPEGMNELSELFLIPPSLPISEPNGVQVNDVSHANVSQKKSAEQHDKLCLPTAQIQEEKVSDQLESSSTGIPRPDKTETVWKIPLDLQPFAVTPVMWNADLKVLPPILLRGSLRPYQQSGLEWLASLNNNKMNGILADEMGLGKTIQTIALLAHLACDRGIWGPHLIIVPTSVLLNWEMEFKKFLPGFHILSYHGNAKRRKELRRGWSNKHSFNVCVTSYTLAIKDQHILKRKPWYYMILDEAHMIKNFKSQRWNILLMFKSYRRLLLTGTPLQNNLTELWALLQFLMTSTNFANQREFSEWFSNPLEKAIEQGNVQDEEVQLQVARLHSVLRPYLLRRLKIDVERELPKKYDHLVLCRLSKRQRFLYDEFMSRSQTKNDLESGVYQRIANVLMQLRKVCNHPDLFEVRPIVTSFAMDRSAIAGFEIKELLVRRRLLEDKDRFEECDLSTLSLRFTDKCNTPLLAARTIRFLKESLPQDSLYPNLGPEPAADLITIVGYRKYSAYRQRVALAQHYQHIDYLNGLRCRYEPIYGSEILKFLRHRFQKQPSLIPVTTYARRSNEMLSTIERFAFATPPVVVLDMPSIALREMPDTLVSRNDIDLDEPLHRAAVKLQIAFPDPSLLQYDCGKLQELADLLLERKRGGHRVLIFTQMTKILDILEMFLNFHGYLYLRLDGATKIEDRQYITERFNVDARVFAFIASSRSGGVGINLTGADTVIFYDSDFNPQMDRQCEDRAHRIGQVRDVHIFRFISQYTVEEAMLRKANQKRHLDDIVIQKGDFDWQNFFGSEACTNATALSKALVEFEDFEDANAAKIVAREEAAIEGEEKAEFADVDGTQSENAAPSALSGTQTPAEGPIDGDEEGMTVTDYMLRVVREDLEFFRAREWKMS